MVRRISEVLGDPTIYTKALANQFLPFVVEWDVMSEEAKHEMYRFWGALHGGSSLGNYAYLMKVGIFNEEYDELRATWRKKGGDRAFALQVGIHDPANAAVVHAGRIKGGVTSHENGVGIHDPANAAVVHAGRVKGGVTSHENGVGIHDTANNKVVQDGRQAGRVASGLVRKNKANANVERMIQFVEEVCVIYDMLFLIMRLYQHSTYI